MSRTHYPRPEHAGGRSAREEILGRLRTALADQPSSSADGNGAPQHPEPAREFGYAGADHASESKDLEKIRDMLVGRLEDYRATVHRTTAEQLPEAIAAALDGARTIRHAADIPAAWLTGLAAGTDLAPASGADSARALEGVDAALTRAHTAIALTGTLALRSSATEGHRVLSLIPDRHVVIVDAADVVRGVPAGIARLAQDPSAAWTLVSGPSATSDIELERVEGVHGPRDLRVVLIEPGPENQTQEETA